MLAVQDILLLRFARHGMLLLLAGLLTGFGIGKFHSHHLGSAPDAPLNSVGQSAGSWDAISGFILLIAALFSAAATLIVLVGLRPELQGHDKQK